MNINNLDYEINYVTISKYVRNLCYFDKDELKDRIYGLLDRAEPDFGFKQRDFFLFSSPGRTELAGNHTDHNRGIVLAGSINLDNLAVVSRRNDKTIRIFSETLKQKIEFSFENEKFEILESEFGTTKSLVRGILKFLSDKGYQLSTGFDMYVESRVLIGSGLSSSASFEVLVAKIITFLSGDENADPVMLSMISQKAENVFFGKPCGLMDQVACAYGGIVSIDFENPDEPIIDHVNVNFSKDGFLLCITDVRADHADLTEDYSAITREMFGVAGMFGKKQLRDVAWRSIRENAQTIRDNMNDRAILRSYHFYKENERVERAIKALRHNSTIEYLGIINESGDSSTMYLQNLYSSQNPLKQELLLGVLLTRDFLSSRNVAGASRVHGGGFGGTIQSYIPHSVFADYKKYMETLFGPGSVMQIAIRPEGVIKLF